MLLLTVRGPEGVVTYYEQDLDFKTQASIQNRLTNSRALTMQNTINIPKLTNQSLSEYVLSINARYPQAEFYKEKMRDSGRDEGPTLLLTVCENDEILEEESFFYANQSELDEDLDNLVYYLDFA